MNFIFNVDEELKVGIKRLATLIGFGTEGDGTQVRAVCCPDKLGVSIGENGATVYYQRKHQFFREIGILAEKVKNGESGDFFEDVFFDTPSVMLDASRGAVANCSGLYKFIDYLAVMGFGAALLYTEDTAELPGRPYFGYMRGRYTKQELQRIDDYADSYGIELIPCIECYGHMGKYLLWGEAEKIKDTSEVLLAREDETFKFLDSWIGQISSCFRSKKIHVGMDEAWDMGRGKFLDRNGFVPRFDIFNEYMDRLITITDKYGLKPMMWSDMYFRISSKSGVDYYDEDAVVPDWVREKIPQNMNLVYWHYGRLKGIDDYMLEKHVDLGREVTYAGGLWGWSGHLPEHGLAEGSKAALAACRRHGVKNAMTTIWSNDNAECDLFSQLIGLSFFAEHVYDEKPSEEKLKARFKATTGGDYDAFHKMGDYHNVFDGREYKSFQHRFFGKLLFWQDVLEGMYDANLFTSPMSAHYEECRDFFKKYSDEGGEWTELYIYVCKIFDYLALKTYIAEHLVPAYKAGDKDMLKKLADELFPSLIEKTEAVHAAHKARWFSYNKAVGWSNLDIRYAGVVSRCKSAIDLITAYLCGDITEIEELEVERLTRPLSAFTKYGAIASPMGLV